MSAEDCSNAVILYKTAIRQVEQLLNEVPNVEQSSTKIIHLHLASLKEAAYMLRSTSNESYKEISSQVLMDAVARTENFLTCTRHTVVELTNRLEDPPPVIPQPALPKITIPNFDGRIEQWHPFWTVFKAVIHDRQDMHDIIKFTMLNSYLRGRAREAIAGLAITPANYAMALTQLQDRFSDVEKLEQDLRRQLLDLPHPEHDAEQLIDFLNKWDIISQQLVTLTGQAGGGPYEKEIVIRCLSDETKKYLYHKYDTNILSVDQVRNGIAKLTAILGGDKTCNPTSWSSNSVKGSPYRNKGPKNEHKVETKLFDVVRVKVQAGTKGIKLNAVVCDHVNTSIHTPGQHNVYLRLQERGVKLADIDIESDTLSDIGLIIGVDYYNAFVYCQSNYDIGMLNTVKIRGKLVVKKLRELKTTWDGDLRIDLKKEFDELLSQLKTTEEIRVPRSCFDEGSFSAHVFVDASQMAYGACTYVVNILWFQGPTWIIDQNQFPEQEDVVYGESANVSEILVEPSLRFPDDDVIIFNCSEFSSLKRALRIVGKLIQFGRRIFPEKFQKTNNLLVLIRIMQRQAFPTLYYALNNGLQENSSVPSDLRNLIRQLGLYVDESGVIRCQGRIQNADLSKSAKHPVYVASRHPLWPLIVSHYHVLNLHCNTNTLVIILRQQFWAGKIRQSVKKILKACLLCKKVQNQPLSIPGFPPLPPERVKHEVPFSCVGSVYMGNISVSESEAENEKGQFAAKHGLPKLLISDNASNFVAAIKFLREISEEPELVDLPYHENVDLRENYAELCETIRKFEKLWLYDYLSSLRERHRNVESSNICPLNVRDLVLIVNENSKRYKYPLGIIKQLYAGPDDVIRTVEIKTASGNFMRPLNQVIPLECNVKERSSTDNKDDDEGEAQDTGDDTENTTKGDLREAPPLQMKHDRRPMRRAAAKAEERIKQLIRDGAL
ncbi:uncharacterized protein [Palaemon carinicauda]|uniref:uncharacterized protein n=1 Tax=Palaemon carinicauda TaxID=392227 RepID=UPI0035B68BDC